MALPDAGYNASDLEILSIVGWKRDEDLLMFYRGFRPDLQSKWEVQYCVLDVKDCVVHTWDSELHAFWGWD